MVKMPVMRVRNFNDEIDDIYRANPFKTAEQQIREETLKRRKKYQSHHVEIGHAYGGITGRQTICDIPVDTTWQKEVLDQTGRAFAINKDYVCTCGQKYNQSMPPTVCFRCGKRSFLEDKKFVNLKR